MGSYTSNACIFALVVFTIGFIDKTLPEGLWYHLGSYLP